MVSHGERIILHASRRWKLKRSPWAVLECRKKCEMSSHELTEAVGAYGQVNNGGAVSNWNWKNIPSREQYIKICGHLLKQVKMMPAYEDVVRAFSVNLKDYFTDVGTYECAPIQRKAPC